MRRRVNTVSGNNLVWAFYLSFSRRPVPFCAASRREPDVSSGWALPVVERGRGLLRCDGLCALRLLARSIGAMASRIGAVAVAARYCPFFFCSICSYALMISVQFCLASFGVSGGFGGYFAISCLRFLSSCLHLFSSCLRFFSLSLRLASSYLFSFSFSSSLRLFSSSFRVNYSRLRAASCRLFSSSFVFHAR